MRSTSDAAGTDHDLHLYVYQQPEGENLDIEMSFLGRKRFEELLIDLDIYDPNKPIKVETSRKNN